MYIIPFGTLYIQLMNLIWTRVVITNSRTGVQVLVGYKSPVFICRCVSKIL